MYSLQIAFYQTLPHSHHPRWRGRRLERNFMRISLKLKCNLPIAYLNDVTLSESEGSPVTFL